MSPKRGSFCGTRSGSQQVKADSRPSLLATPFSVRKTAPVLEARFTRVLTTCVPSCRLTAAALRYLLAHCVRRCLAVPGGAGRCPAAGGDSSGIFWGPLVFAIEANTLSWTTREKQHTLSCMREKGNTLKNDTVYHACVKTDTFWKTTHIIMQMSYVPIFLGYLVAPCVRRR